MTLKCIFDNLWDQYLANNPQARSIHTLLTSNGENILNDHIAFRTFNHPKVNINVLSSFFLNHGYERKGSYDFPAKKLNAVHLEHPSPDYPLIFVSELRLEEFSQELQDIVHNLINQVDPTSVSNATFLWSGIPWKAISFDTYKQLLEESEYAAWTATFGYCANHFTIYVNALENYNLVELNTLLQDQGYQLNSAGGLIKGSQEQGLMQSSTMAAETVVIFSDQEAIVPCCYYEFAERFEINGKEFRGFIAKSADKIFQSTDTKESSKES